MQSKSAIHVHNSDAQRHLNGWQHIVVNIDKVLQCHRTRRAPRHFQAVHMTLTFELLDPRINVKPECLKAVIYTEFCNNNCFIA